MTRLLVLACLLALSGCAAIMGGAMPPRTTLSDIGGRWSGSANQWNSGDTSTPIDSQWSVELTIRSGPEGSSGLVGTVAYPSLGCSGRLTYIGPGAGSSHMFREDIDVGADRCIPTGMVTLERGEDVVLYSAQHDGSTSVSMGVLTTE